MRKILIASCLSLFALAAAAIATASAQSSAQTRPPVPRLMAQPDRVLPPGRGRGGPPNPDQLAHRRADRCDEVYARFAGRLTYLETRLELTGAQRAAFDRWRDIRLAAAKRRAENCGMVPEPAPEGQAARQRTPPGPVERLTREEERLQQRLADIRAERPALEALVNSLTPNQRLIFNRTVPMAGRGGIMGGRGGPMMRGRMTFRRGPDGNMMFRRGPAGRGDMPPPDITPPPRQPS